MFSRFTLNRSATAGSTTKDISDSTPKEEKQDVVVPVLESEQVDHLSRSAIVWRKGRIAVKRARWRRLVYALVGILLITIWCGVTVNFAQTETKNQDKNVRGADELTETSRGRDRNQGFFLLQGNLVDFDSEKRALTVSWAGLYLLDGNVEPFGTSTNSAFTIGVYTDEAVIVDDDPTYGLRLQNLTALPIGVYANPWQSIDTDIDMGQESPDNAWRQPEYGFPFDHWTGNITFGATFRDCSPNVTESNLCGTYWDFAYLTGSIINWKFTLTPVDTCQDLSVNTCNMIVVVNATRSGLVIFACVVAVIVNWLSTIFIFVMTMEGVVMQRFEVIEGPQLLAVCFTALFALPSVRSILPGAPEFGALIDLVGIVPNVIIISLCTTMVAVATLRKFIHRNNAKSDAIAAAATAELAVEEGAGRRVVKS